MEIEQMIKEFGGPSRMARALGVSRMTIYNWRKQGKMPQLPKKFAEMVLEQNERKNDEIT